MNEKIAGAGSLIVTITVVFFAVYAVLIVIVYFAQITTVRLESLTEQAAQILDYSKGGLLFNYDLLGYGFMALSTFFTGLTIEAKLKADKVLKWLMLMHGIFFLVCLIMPITGVLRQTADADAGKGGVIVLVVWCAYFVRVGLLSDIQYEDELRGEKKGER